MREPERDISRLEHILSAIECVEDYISGISEEGLKNDKLHLHATIYNVQVIGEAVYKLTTDFKHRHPDTPWVAIEKMRQGQVQVFLALAPTTLLCQYMLLN